MKKTFSKSLIALLLVSSMLVLPAYADNVTVTGDYVNFRSGPGTGYGVISCLRYGSVVSVTGTEGDWTAVVYNGNSGYISSRYLSSYVSEPVISDESSISDNTSVSESASDEASVSDDTAVEATPVPSPSPTPSSGSNRKIVVIGTGSSGNKTVITYGSYKDSSDTSSQEYTENVTDNSSSSDSSSVQVEDNSSLTDSSASSNDTSVVSSDVSNSGYINGDYVRFRSGPSTSYTILGTYNKGKSLIIEDTVNDWTKCSIDGKSGFVYSQYVKTGSYNTVSLVSSETSSSDTSVSSESVASESYAVTKAGYISGNNVRFRSGPSLDADIIGEFYYANSVTITGTSGDWTSISANGKTGYVYSKYVKEGTYTSSESSSDETSSASGQAVADYAMQFLGTPYKWGGTDPSGFDCSGFVYYVYKHFGITLNRVAQDQASNGTHVDSSNLQSGDILCFYSGSNYIGHVGIYIGNGKFIHSATSNTGVIITNLSGYYTTRGYEARRIVN